MIARPIRPSLCGSGPIEVVVQADSSVPRLTAVKGMLLLSSQEGLRALGHYQRYATLLGPSRLARLGQYLGNEWVPLESMQTHYGACDALALGPPELEAMGRMVAERLQRRLLTTLTSAARGVGFDVWTALGPLSRLAGRVFQGSAACVLKVGPKDMESTIFGNPLLDFTYFRVAYCGTIHGMLGLLGARGSYVNILRHSPERCSLTLRASWV